MKTKIFVFFACLILSVFLLSCGTQEQETNPYQNPQPTVNQSENWDWITLEEYARNCFSDPVGANDDLISSAIASWEDANTDREIIDLDIIVQPDAYATCTDVIGISIYSKPIQQESTDLP